MQAAEKLQSVRRLIKLLGWIEIPSIFLGKITKIPEKFRLSIDFGRNKTKKNKFKVKKE